MQGGNHESKAYCKAWPKIMIHTFLILVPNEGFWITLGKIMRKYTRLIIRASPFSLPIQGRK